MRIFLAILLLQLVACTKSSSDGSQRKKITVMTFNVENLFDTEDDPKKNDETFLPKAKKSSSEILKKCKKIKVRKWREQCLNCDWNETRTVVRTFAIRRRSDERQETR